MSGDLLKAIRAMYQANEACVRVDGEMAEWFEASQGVRQGCPMSPCCLSRYGGPKARVSFWEECIEYMQGAGIVVCR